MNRRQQRRYVEQAVKRHKQARSRRSWARMIQPPAWLMDEDLRRQRFEDMYRREAIAERRHRAMSRRRGLERLARQHPARRRR